MRKFKIKNRQKRKYVKKRDLRASLSTTQTLTVGFVPLLLMAVAFFATVLMINPPTQKFQTPQISFSLPAVPQMSFSLPEMPKFTLTLPEFTMPQLPELTFSLPKLPDIPQISLPEAPEISLPEITLPTFSLPDMRPALENAFGALSFFMQSAQQLVSVAVPQLLGYAERLAVFLDPRIFLEDTGEFAYQILSYTYSGTLTAWQVFSVFVQNAWIVTSAFVVSTTNTVIQFLSEMIAVITQWIVAAFQTIGNGIAAFFWLLGTPFRALAAYSNATGQFFAPYMQFLSQAFDQATDELAVGGENLTKGTIYFSQEVAHNQENAKNE